MRIYWKIKDWIFDIKMWWQRKTRGWADVDIWNFETTAAEWILPRLKAFRDNTIAHPGDLNSIEDWYAILDEMIFGFEFYLKQFEEYNKRCFMKRGSCSEEEYKILVAEFETDCDRATRGRELFGKWFKGLWW